MHLHQLKRKLRPLLIGLLLLSGTACERQTREFPLDRKFFIGTWDYRELYTQVGAQSNLYYTELNGFVRFRSGLSTALNFSGNFEVSYRDSINDTTYNYSGNFKWRVDGTSLVVTMEGLEDEPLYPALGFGAGTQDDFVIDLNRVKENFMQLYTNVDAGFTGVFNAAFLERR